MSDLTLSVVVPAYNEAEDIRSCLENLLTQTRPVDEIVVADNNSTDETVLIVEEIALRDERVRLLRVEEQGVINARSAGLDAATGDVLARIDADSHVPPGWAESVIHFFAQHGKHYGAATGLCSCHDLPFQDRFSGTKRRLTENARAALAGGDRRGADATRLFGSNMAITRDAWNKVRQSRSHRTDIFEDLDLTLTLHEEGVPMGLMPDAEATISGRRYLSSPTSYLRYCLRDQRTFALHGRPTERGQAIAQMLLVALPFYFVMWIPFRTYDPDNHEFSVRRLLRRRQDRPAPGGPASG
ncbi:glycosyltransferase [Williamsia sterculiae]|uniref:Glycosyl transferase family 2 n=1 Tax=Williamsia sterculiae TaxID=1344003 RepID=A0A1N7DMH2_9NOCA|nr:glycosyltransferase family 2 protein [Williamsia sterculiae]SIR76895.1 Glycosyl transferase family 2 [Williamsia sterculiae]